MTQEADDEARRAAEEAERLVSEGEGETKAYGINLLDREAEAVLVVVSHVNAVHLLSLMLGQSNESQVVEGSSAVLLQKLQMSKTGRHFEGPIEIKASYVELDGFSRELQESFPLVVSMVKTLGNSEPEIYIAQIPLILNNALIAVGGKDNLDLRRTWEPFIEPDQS